MENKKKKSTPSKMKDFVRESQDFKGNAVSRDLHGIVQGMQTDSRKNVLPRMTKSGQMWMSKGPIDFGSFKPKSRNIDVGPKSPLMFKVVRNDDVVKGGCIIEASSNNTGNSNNNRKLGNNGISLPIICLKRHRLGFSPMAMTVSKMGKLD